MRLALIALCALTLAACSGELGVRRATLESGGTILTFDGGAAGHSGQFCPPGQAKKGRC